MKLKYYLRGCGGGILVTAIIFMIALQAKGGIMTDRKVMERASELGMVTREDTQEKTDTQGVSETQQDTDTQQNTENRTSSETQKATEVLNNTENKENGSSRKSTQAEEHKKLQEEKDDSSEDRISISVNNGDVCRDVARKLYDKGLVEDAEEFRVYMGEHGYDRQLFVGSFEIKKGMSYEQIAKILTKK